MTADFLIYECVEHGDYRVPVELLQGEWVVESGAAERCPVCHQFGRDLEGEDPDAYWQAASRCGEEEEDDQAYWTERGNPALSAGERNR